MTPLGKQAEGRSFALAPLPRLQAAFDPQNRFQKSNAAMMAVKADFPCKSGLLRHAPKRRCADGCLYMVQKKLNKRKPSSALSDSEVKYILKAWARAKAIGLPLNAFITVKPFAFYALSASARCQEVQRIRNLYGAFARRHKFPAAAIVTRECEPSGSNEHFHMLCHIPKWLRNRFFKTAADWQAERGEIDIRAATYKEKWTRNGKVHSVGHYICKQMSQQAAYGRPYSRQRGGVIMGKRWGCTRNLRIPGDNSARLRTLNARRIVLHPVVKAGEENNSPESGIP